MCWKYFIGNSWSIRSKLFGWWPDEQRVFLTVRGLCNIRPSHSNRLRGRIVVENSNIINRSGAMRPTNQNVLDLYLATICSGNVESKDLDYLLTWRQSDNSGDQKLIQHIRAKVASGEIRVLGSNKKLNNLSESQLKLRKTNHGNNSVSKTKLLRDSSWIALRFSGLIYNQLCTA